MEESLLKQAQDEATRREREHFEEESEIERLAELRRKGRGKGKGQFLNIPTRQQSKHNSLFYSLCMASDGDGGYYFLNFMPYIFWISNNLSITS